jgi:hypothetical protein
MSLRSEEAARRAPSNGAGGGERERGARGSESAQLIEKARRVDEKSIWILLRWAFEIVALGL